MKSIDPGRRYAFQHRPNLWDVAPKVSVIVAGKISFILGNLFSGVGNEIIFYAYEHGEFKNGTV